METGSVISFLLTFSVYFSLESDSDILALFSSDLLFIVE